LIADSDVTGSPPLRLLQLLPSKTSEFGRQVGWTFATRLGVVSLGLVGSVLIARWLGPFGRGEYAVALAVAAIAVQLGNLGLHTSSSWAVSQRPDLAGRLLANGVLASLTVGLILAVGIRLVTITFPEIVPLPEPLFVLALVSIPFSLLYLLALNLLLGLQRIREYNTLELANRLGSVVLLAIAVALGVLTSTLAYVTVLVGTVGAAVTGVIWLLRWSRTVRIDRSVLIEYGRYGVRAYFAALFTYLVLRVDLLLVQYLRGSADAGLYSVAVGLADMLNLLPVVVGTLLFPRLSAERDAVVAWSIARRAALLVLGGISVLALVAAVLSGPAVAVLYGESFERSATAFQLLLPGVIFLSVQTVLMHYFYSVGAPAVTLYAPLLGTVANLGLNLILIPKSGIAGASVASTISYGLMLVWSWRAFTNTRPSGAGALAPP